MTHALKTWPEYFKELKDGKKKFELRRDDRPFEIGDKVVLQEYDPKLKTYSGQEVEFRIGYLLRKDGELFGLKKGFVIIGLEEPFT